LLTEKKILSKRVFHVVAHTVPQRPISGFAMEVGSCISCVKNEGIMNQSVKEA
jgi:hypothetical protein